MTYQVKDDSSQVRCKHYKKVYNTWMLLRKFLLLVDSRKCSPSFTMTRIKRECENPRDSLETT